MTAKAFIAKHKDAKTVITNRLQERPAWRELCAGLEERRSALRENYPFWTKRTLYGHLQAAAGLWPDRILYRDAKTSLTYAQILALSDRAAHGFAQLGIGQGDRVAVNLNNTSEYLILTFALAKTGAVKVPLNRKLPLQQKCYILSETGACVLISDKSEDVEALRLCASLRRIIMPGHADMRGTGIISWENFMSVLAHGPEDASVHETYVSGICVETTQKHSVYQQDPDCNELPSSDNPVKDTAFGMKETLQQREPADLPCDIIYTSGSSGAPKGVVLTHDMILRSAFANCLNRAFEDGRRVLITVPLFHVYGYIEGLLSVIFVGGTLFCMQGRFEEEKTLRILQDQHIHDILCVPSAMQKILSVPEFGTYDLSGLHAVYCSASVCPDWLWDEMKAKLGDVEIVTGYGMSEVSGASVQTSPEDSFFDMDKLRHTLGRVLTDHFTSTGEAGSIAAGPGSDPAEQQAAPSAAKLVEYRVVDPRTIADLPAGETGELLCRGAIVTKGYFHRDDVNETVFLTDGWLRTGDLGRFDEDGYLVFLGRDGDNYKINGENVSPLYIDQVISESRDVIQAQTVGIPDAKLGWVGVAFIEPAAFCPASKNRIMEYCSEHLASFQVPKYYFFISGREWPRTSNGKVTKKLLREQAVRLLKRHCGSPELDR